MLKSIRRSRIKIKPLPVKWLAIAFGLLNFVLRWPGHLTPDSARQLSQAAASHFDDWHPPLMAWIWQWLIPFGNATASMLAFQIALHWLGIGLFAGVINRGGSYKAALLMLISGFTPIALTYTGVIQKDSLLASFFIAGFGLVAWNSVQLKGVGILMVALGTLTRMNGVFAAPALLFLVLRRRWSLPKIVLSSMILSLALIPLAQWINHEIFHAERTGVEKSLQLFDLAGIAYFSGDSTVLPVSIPNIEKCYTPLFWDTLVTDRCDKAFQKINRGIGHEWFLGIAEHPFAYIEHRLTHFNRTIFFLVPPAQQCVDAPEMHDCPRSFISDTIAKNGLLWPVAWLTLGTAMLLLGLGDIARCLCLSGLLYGFAYIVVGVATDFRYFYWTELSIQTALIFQIATTGFPRWRIAAIAVFIIWLMGYAWRLLSTLS